MTLPVRISADDTCIAVREVLKAGLPLLTEQLGVAKTYGPITEWQQLPTREAIASARLPAASISDGGLVEPPTYSRADDAWTTVWRVVVSVYDRGRDHDDTQARVRDWCALVRTVLLANKTLGGAAVRLAWSGEEHALVPNRNSARTFGGGAIAVDVTVQIPSLPLSGPLPGAGPIVLDTTVDVTTKE